MRRMLFIALAIWSLPASAQVNIIPMLGVNSTRMKMGSLYEKGGSFLLGGVELEFRRRPKETKPVFVSLVTGVGYLDNGFYYSSNFAYTALSYYEREVTEINAEYWQIPLMLKINWQPFPLVEDWRVFTALGVSSNITIRATMAEEYTFVFLNDDVFAPPETTYYSDSQDVTDLAPKSSMFLRFDLGMVVRRFQFAWRMSFSTSDQYFSGIESTWAIPDEDSPYISSHDENGKMPVKYSELVLGFRLFKN